MHIKYPKKKDFFTWDELGCLAKALGFQKALFYKNMPPEMHKERLLGLDNKTLSEVLDMKVLHGDIHRTYNMHDALYNTHVIEKAADMLSKRYLSFQELREVRVAFQLYEHDDMMGLVTDEPTLLRTLKVCGRTVSPVKLMQHIKHMEQHVENRLMMYEFMDLLLLCEREADVEVPPLPSVSGLDRNRLFKICDFKKVLMPEDERKLSQLNNSYEQGLFKSHLSNTSQPHPTWRAEQNYIVDDQPRIEQVSRHQQRSLQLTDHLGHSNRKVLTARCGHVGMSRSFVDLNDVIRKGKSTRSYGAATNSGSPFPPGVLPDDEDEERDTRVNFAATPPKRISISPAPSPPSTTESQFYVRNFPGTTPEKLSRLSRTDHREILVTPRDVHNAYARVENLNWDIETQNVRLKRKIDKQMRDKYPRSYVIYRNRQRPSFVLQRTRKASKAIPKDDFMTSLEYERATEDHSYEVKISPRRYKPKRDNIYSTLKSRLQNTDTLLDYGGVEVPFSRFSLSLARQLDSKREDTSTTKIKTGPNNLDINTLGSLPDSDELGRDSDREDSEVVQLLEKFQAANYIASGKKGVIGDAKDDWKYTTVV